jgi:superfamily II DNA or RNA helicase
MNKRHVIFLTSPTGSGKSYMMYKIISKCPNKFFVVTTLSKSELPKQLNDAFKRYHKLYGTSFSNYDIIGNSMINASTTLLSEKEYNEKIIQKAKGKDII